MKYIIVGLFLFTAGCASIGGSDRAPASVPIVYTCYQSGNLNNQVKITVHSTKNSFLVETAKGQRGKYILDHGPDPRGEDTMSFFKLDGDVGGLPSDAELDVSERSKTTVLGLSGWGQPFDCQRN